MKADDGLYHEDKCRVWDDSEFCDCGSREYERMQNEIDRLTRELSDKEAEVGRLMEEINTGRCSHCGAAIPTCDTAFQQGCEATREKAATIASLRVQQAEHEDDEFGADAAGDVADAIRSMPLPTRGEEG